MHLLAEPERIQYFLPLSLNQPSCYRGLFWDGFIFVTLPATGCNGSLQRALSTAQMNDMFVVQ